MPKNSHRPSDGTHVGQADECSQTKALSLSEKCNNHTHSQNTMQDILKKGDRPADGVGRADEGSQANLLPLAKKYEVENYT